MKAPRPLFQAAVSLVAAFLGAGSQSGDAAHPLRFAAHTIATGIEGGYQVVPFDLSGDGRLDVIALGTRMTELVWFEAPGWQRHVLASGLIRMINLAILEHNGRPVILLGSGFSNIPKESIGNIWQLEPTDDVRQPWKVREIDRLPMSHRFQLADIDGSGQRVVISAPLTAADTTAPEYRGRTPLVLYRPGEWRRILISNENEGVVHGLAVADWDGDQRDDLLTASFRGIHRYQWRNDGQWNRTEITSGDPTRWPNSGSSDVAIGRLPGQRFLASLEPWHGDQVVVYQRNHDGWTRQVIDDTFREGHALTVGDLDGDGRDEIVAGYRLGGGGLFIYRAEDDDGQRWQRHALDPTDMAASACVITDLDGDGDADIVAIGAATANVKWYENTK